MYPLPPCKTHLTIIALHQCYLYVPIDGNSFSIIYIFFLQSVSSKLSFHNCSLSSSLKLFLFFYCWSTIFVLSTVLTHSIFLLPPFYRYAVHIYALNHEVHTSASMSPKINGTSSNEKPVSCGVLRHMLPECERFYENCIAIYNPVYVKIISYLYSQLPKHSIVIVSLSTEVVQFMTKLDINICHKL